MPLIDGLLQELEEEARTTRRDPSPNSAAELIPALEQSIANAKTLLGGMDDAALMATWRLMQGERELLAIPRAAFLRSERGGRS